MKKNILLVIILIIGLHNIYAKTKKDKDYMWYSPIVNYYNIDVKETQKILPFGFYINEAGFMLGALYYNTNIMESKTKLTSVLLYSPSYDTGVSWTNLYDLKVARKTYLFGSVNFLKFNDQRVYWMGNDSPNNEIEYVSFPNPQNNSIVEIPKNKGYKEMIGWANNLVLGSEYRFNDKNIVYAKYRYDTDITKSSDYTTDELYAGYTYQNLDNKDDPNKGFKCNFEIGHSLDLLGHSEGNDWDYYRINADLRGYIPISKTVLALRCYTSHINGKEVEDKERSMAMNYMESGNPLVGDNHYKEIAPFTSQVLFGSLDTFKGFRYYRYHDNNGLLFQGELRFPIYGTRLQGVALGELGRVAGSYNLETLFSNMQYCWGGGLRFFFNEHFAVRADCVHSEEEILQIRASLGHTF